MRFKKKLVSEFWGKISRATKKKSHIQVIEAEKKQYFTGRLGDSYTTNV